MNILAVIALSIASILLTGVQQSCSAMVSGGCSPKERDALIKFKSKIEDPNEFLYAWKGKECCKWKGVFCSNSSDIGVHVIKLELRNIRLYSGEFNSSFLYLKYLQHLDLSGIRFIQSSVQVSKSNLILDLISEFHDLRYLNLSHTLLVGIVPSKLGNLSRIQYLDLSGNSGLSLENGYLLSKFSFLKYLDMSGVSLWNTSGWLESLNTLSLISVIGLSNCDIESISDSLIPHVNFTSLVKLDLSNNPMIHSAFPDWLFQLPNIKDLNFQSVVWSPNDNIIGFPLGIQILRELRSFDFSGNHLGGSIPKSLGEFSPHLRKINLSNNNFNGSIPESIGNLSYLEEINFSDNKLIGSVPKSIGNLSLLKIIDFSSNKLTFSIPESIFEISSLQNLNLRNNNLSGLIPPSIGTKISSLQQLNLNTNGLTGFIPTSIGNLKYLVELGLGHNQLLGPIPESLCNLYRLAFLYLSNNDNMNGTIPNCIFQNPLLEVLDVGGKDLKGVISESDFEKLSNLWTLKITGSKSLVLNISINWIPPFSLSFLYLSFCEIGSEFPTWIQTQKDIEILSITNTRISGTLPKWIWDFSSSITYIHLSSNGLMGNLPDFAYTESYGFLSDFDINLRNNKFEGSIPSSLCKMNLTTLDLSRNYFTGEIPGCLMDTNGILNLANNNLHGAIPSSNNSICNLQVLNLENNNFSGILPISLKLCNNIVILDVGNNKLSGKISLWDSDAVWPSLKVLILRSNMFSGKIPSLLSNLSSLQLLDLSQNHLSGRIPKSFGDFYAMSQKHMIDEEMAHSTFEIGDSSGMLEKGDIYTDDISITFRGSIITYTKLLPLFTSIDLSMNELDGEVPRELGNLTFLVNLNLSRNHLTARIPDTIGALKDLIALDLSQNNLSGQIPKSMLRMTLLSYLNLSFNNLSGSIPTGFQFQTFADPLVYANNPYLCGFPLEKSCGDDHEETPILVSDEKNIDSVIIGAYISSALGVILGFWSFYGTLFFNKTWRYSYFQFLNEMNEIMYVWYICNVRKMFN